MIVITVIFLTGCDSSNIPGENNEPVVFEVNDEISLISAFENIGSGDNIVLENNISGDVFSLEKSSGTYNLGSRSSNDENNQLSGNVNLGIGETINVIIADIDINDELSVNIGQGSLDLNNVYANNIVVESAGSNSIKINSNSEIEHLKIKGENIRVVVNENTVVENFEVGQNAEGVVIDGKGSIKTATINADNVSFSDIVPDDILGEKVPSLPDDENEDIPGDEDDESEEDDDGNADNELTEPEEGLDLGTGYINFYMKSDNISTEAVDIMNNSNNPNQPGNNDGDSISEVNVIIERIEFNNHDGSGWHKWEAFSGPEKVDLLSENLYEEFNIKGEAETGEFDSLRIFVVAEYSESLNQDNEESENGDNDEGDSENGDEETEDEVADDEEKDSDEAEEDNDNEIDDGDDGEDVDDPKEGDSFDSISHVVYENGEKEGLSVNAASNAGIKVKGDFSVEGGITTEVELSFLADELINMRGPRVKPMLMPRAFHMESRRSGVCLAVKIEDYIDLDEYSIKLLDVDENAINGSYIEDEEGWYVFSGLTEGKYNLEVDARGYELFESEVDLVEGERKEVAVNLIPLEEDEDKENDEEDIEDGDEETDDEVADDEEKDSDEVEEDNGNETDDENIEDEDLEEEEENNNVEEN